MKHPHAEEIIGWANGLQIQYRDVMSKDWVDTDSPNWKMDVKYRIKPAEPEREPLVAMSNSEIEQFFQCYPGSGMSAAVASVHEAVQRSIDKGTLVPRAEFDRAVGDRQKRDMAVAIAIGTAVEKEVRRVQYEKGLYHWNFEEIIASVK